MRWPIYLALDILSIPLITSLVIRTDSSETINPFIGTSPFEPLAPETGVTLKTDSTTLISHCPSRNPGSTNQIQKRQLFSPGPTFSHDRQNEEFGSSAPILISSELGGGASDSCSPDSVQEGESDATREEEDVCPTEVYEERKTPVCDTGLTHRTEHYVLRLPRSELVNVEAFNLG